MRSPTSSPRTPKGCGWSARRQSPSLAVARPHVERCFEAGAIATGTQLTIEDVAPDYSQLDHCQDIVDVYRANAVALGRTPDDEHEMTFSTDMGNVSLEIPSIHPCIGIEAGGAMNHQPEFAGACVNASADRAVLEGALAMAWTAIDLATGPLRAQLTAGGQAQSAGPNGA